MDLLVRWLHLLAAAVWVGGLITLAALVPPLRKAGADRATLQAMARQFGRVAWTAMLLSIATGVFQLTRFDLSAGVDSTFGRLLFLKLLLVGVAAALTLGHQLTARSTSPKVRGLIQGLIMLVSVGIVGAAVAMGAA